MGGFRYFGEREAGEQQAVGDVINEVVWGGIVAAVHTRIDDGSLAQSFPAMCADSPVIAGTEERGLALAFRAENPDVDWPLNTEHLPSTIAVLELVEFFFMHVSQVGERRYHDFFRHHHLLDFNEQVGRDAFREQINRLFRRNRIAYELQENGEIRRLLDRPLGDMLNAGPFNTGDGELDRMLRQARERIFSPDAEQRRDSIEKLWDAWQRLKTLLNADTRRGVDALLRAAAPDDEFRQLLDAEGRALTDIGNAFMIRHTEVDKSPIREVEYVDYLFHRLYALIWLLLRRAGRIR